jgi:hypothetical protein
MSGILPATSWSFFTTIEGIFPNKWDSHWFNIDHYYFLYNIILFIYCSALLHPIINTQAPFTLLPVISDYIGNFQGYRTDTEPSVLFSGN